MYKSKFTFSDGTEEFEGYTDGTLWNGWANVFFTREQLVEVMSPYDVKFLDAHTPLNKRDYPVAIVYFEDEEVLESTPICLETGEILEGYSTNGLEFMEVESE
jgi:hypothetical protein